MSLNRSISTLEFFLAIAVSVLLSFCVFLCHQLTEVKNQSTWFEPVIRKVAAQRDAEALKRQMVEAQCGLHAI